MAYTAPSAETYTVVYKQEGLDGAYAEADKTEDLTKDDVAAALQKIYEGFTIAGTKLDGTTYTVRYTRNSYTVTWDVDGTVTTISCLYGSTITKPEDPVKSGYTFTGWKGYTDGMTMPAEDVTFTAQWSRKSSGTVTPTPTPEPEELPFTDVAEGQWFYEAVQYVYDAELMNGVTDTTFEPDSTTTRGMIVTILYRLAGEPAVTGESAFTDVAEGSWYADAINWAPMTSSTATARGSSPPTGRSPVRKWPRSCTATPSSLGWM